MNSTKHYKNVSTVKTIFQNSSIRRNKVKIVKTIISLSSDGDFGEKILVLGTCGIDAQSFADANSGNVGNIV